MSQSNTNAPSQQQYFADMATANGSQNNTSSESDYLLLDGEGENSAPQANAVPAGGDGNENNVEIPSSSSILRLAKRRRYNRHTAEQRQQMEEFFKECPHPDENQRRELGRLVGLNSLQIKFWFQNKRTQLKNLQDRSENGGLKAQNQELRAQNETYKQILNTALCVDCGGPPPPPQRNNFEEQQLIAENSFLRQEIEKVKKLIADLDMQASQVSNPNMPASNPNMPAQHNLDMAGTSLNEGFDNVQFQHIDMPSSSLQQGLVNNLPLQDDNNIPPNSLAGLNNPSAEDDYLLPGLLYDEGLDNNLQSQDNSGTLQSLFNPGVLGDVVASQNNNIPSSSLTPQGIGNVSSQNNNIMMPSSSLTQGNGSLPFQHNDMLMNSVIQPTGDNVSSQYNSMPLSLINQGVGAQQGAQSLGIAGGMSGGVGSSDPLRSLRSSLPILANRSDKPMIMRLAVESLEEFRMLALAENQIWVIGEYNAEILNENDYFRTFPWGIGPTPLGFVSESSRESMVIPMNHISLIEILMDVAQWSRVFCCIVTKAKILEVVSRGTEGSYDGCIQVMSAEMQVPSILVPARVYNFLRYCKQLQDRSWAVVDVSLDTIRPSATIDSTARRRPSGCLIQALPDGLSTKVTWIEHVEVNTKTQSTQRMYKPLVDSGLAFGARRWMALLNRQCERIATTLVTHIPEGQLSGILINREVRKGLLKLSERMIKSFHIGAGATIPEGWTTLTPSGPEGASHNNTRTMTIKFNNKPGLPTGSVIGALTSFRLPDSPQSIFDCIRNNDFRTQWDVLAAGGKIQQVGRIANGHDPGNDISMLRVESSNSMHANLIILQECSTDSTGSLMVFSPLEMTSVNGLAGGRDPDTIPMLPSGFAIFPDTEIVPEDAPSGGSLVTLAFQIMIESDITKKLSLWSVSSINNLLKNTVEKLKAMLNSNKN